MVLSPLVSLIFCFGPHVIFRQLIDAGIVEEIPEDSTKQGRLRRERHWNAEGQQLRARLHK